MPRPQQRIVPALQPRRLRPIALISSHLFRQARLRMWPRFRKPPTALLRKPPRLTPRQPNTQLHQLRRSYPHP